MAFLEIITWGFGLSPAVSTRDPIIKPESVSSRVDTKGDDQNPHVIICLSHIQRHF